MFCELPIGAVSRATGISESRVAGIETGQREPNSTELHLIQRFLADRLRMVFESDGPVSARARVERGADVNRFRMHAENEDRGFGSNFEDALSGRATHHAR